MHTDLLMWLAILILPIMASIGVKMTFNKYKNIPNTRNLTAERVARLILDINGLQNIRIERIHGELTDHFSPRENVVRLSDSTYGKTSIAAIGVAAHECGHACQHAQNYTPIKIRTAIVPVTNICSRLWYIAFLLGMFIFDAFPQLLYVGIAMFGAVVLFQLATLPVELNASKRAIETLRNNNMLTADELPKAKRVLTAAAMTYVIALVTSVLQFMRLLARAQSRNNRR